VRFGRGIAVYDRASHAPQRTSIRLKLLSEGLVEAQIPQMETGTGSHSVIRRVVAETLGLTLDHVVVRYVGTKDLPFDSGVGGSRVTVSASEAAYRGALDFKKACMERAGGREPVYAELARAGEQIETVTESGGEQGGHHEAATSYCVQIAQVGVDVETGQVHLYEVLAAVDVADIIEPMSHRSQIEGGIINGVGYALTEDLAIEEGRVTAAHLGDYKMPNIADTPALRVELLRNGKGIGARNVKGIGEVGNVPTAAAIANAVADAIGVRIDSLPITAEKVLRALAR
jgi:CO/xanthine dehydrogenase Mo-binding subunit